MIYTVTLNPSLDYIIHVNDFKENTINRVDKEEIYIGGKGINVSTVLNNNAIKSICLGFVGGFTGIHIEDELKKEGIISKFVLVDGNTRINVKMESSGETEINGSGPIISKEKKEEFLAGICNIEDNSTLILSGSVPSSLDKNIYSEIAECVKDKNIKLVVDAEGDLLMNTLKYHPYLIKPNDKELASILHKEINSFEDALIGSEYLQSLGARNIIISMGDKGAVYRSEDGICYTSVAPKGEVKNTIGSGDSMVAGFIAMKELERSDEEAFGYAVACGSASAFSERLCYKQEAQEVLKQVEVQLWK